MRLEQHLGDAGGATEIAFDLEQSSRPAGIQQIRKGVSADETEQLGVGLLAIP
jgi:hypothetical protein